VQKRFSGAVRDGVLKKDVEKKRTPKIGSGRWKGEEFPDTTTSTPGGVLWSLNGSSRRNRGEEAIFKAGRSNGRVP